MGSEKTEDNAKPAEDGGEKKIGDSAGEEKDSSAQPPAKKEPVTELEKLQQYLKYIPKLHCMFVTYQTVEAAIKARNHLYGLPMPDSDGPQQTTYLNIDFMESEEEEEEENEHQPVILQPNTANIGNNYGDGGSFGSAVKLEPNNNSSSTRKPVQKHDEKK